MEVKKKMIFRRECFVVFLWGEKKSNLYLKFSFKSLNYKILESFLCILNM